MTAFWYIAPYTIVKLSVVSEVVTVAIFRETSLDMEALCDPEMSVRFYENARRNNAEGCHFILVAVRT
jgi:uncharacterized protein YqiB (DUF1249 family)